MAESSVVYNDTKKAVTLTADYTEETFVANATLRNIDASAVLRPLDITGNDLVNSIIGGTQDDFIDGGISGDVLRGGEGNDTLLGGEGNDKLYGDAGDDSLLGGAGSDILTGGEGSDIFVYSAGDGKDTITDYVSGKDTVIISSGSIKNSVGSVDSEGNVIFEIGSGQIIFENSANKIIELVNHRGKQVGRYIPTEQETPKLVELTAGNDTYKNTVNGATIQALGGRDSIYNTAANVSIDGGAGNDTLYSAGNNNTLTGGDGSDTFVLGGGNNYVSDYDEDDTIQFEGGSVSAITTASNGDVTFKFGDDKLIVKDAADKLITYIENGEMKTYDGETADDWQLNGTTATYGDLTVKGVTSLDGISLDGKILTIRASSLGTEKVTISDGYTLKLGSDVDKPSTKNSWTLSNSTATYKKITTAGYTLVDNAITYSKKSSKTLATVKGVTSLDGLNLSKKVVTVSASSLGTSNVTISDGYTLKLGSDVDKPSTKNSWTLSGSTAAYKQTTSAGYTLADNSITYTKKSSKTLATVKGVTSLDGLKLSGKVVTVSANSLGTSNVTISDGYTLKLGSDVDKPSTKNSWTLSNSTATYKQTTAAGYKLSDNKISYTKKVSSTLAKVKGVNDKSGLSVSGSTIKLSGDSLASKVTVSGAYTFDFANDYSKATITGSSSDDTIVARGKKIFVKGGAGNDTIKLLGTGTISGGAGDDIFAVKSTAANVISDYEDGDKISLTSGAANFSVSGSDLIINGKISLTGAANESVIYIENGVEKIYKPANASDGVKFNAEKTSATLTVNYELDTFDAADYPSTLVTIDASAVMYSLEIFGNKNANKITGTAEDDYIDGGAGNDSLSGGHGNDTLIGNSGNDTVNGGAGDDSLWGGTGNDMLFGGEGEDVFVYKAGDGKDIISDYDSSLDAVIILSGKVENPSVDSVGNVTFKVGSRQITFANSAKKYIELVDTVGNILTKYLPA